LKPLRTSRASLCERLARQLKRFQIPAGRFGCSGPQVAVWPLLEEPDLQFPWGSSRSANGQHRAGAICILDSSHSEQRIHYRVAGIVSPQNGCCRFSNRTSWLQSPPLTPDRRSSPARLVKRSLISYAIPSGCPTPDGNLAGMKNRITDSPLALPEEIVAVFGEARLIRSGGELQLRGGSMADRAEALEWLAIFIPDEVACVQR